MTNNTVKAAITFIMLILFSCNNNNRPANEFYRDGSIKKKIIYSNNMIKEIVSYYDDGAVYSRSKYSNYSDGDCVITLYSTEGNIIGLMNYSSGVKHGEFIWYNTKGEILMKENYNNGKLVD